MFYKEIKFGIYLFYKMSGTYNCTHNTKRLSNHILFHGEFFNDMSISSVFKLQSMLKDSIE